ncbi:MAG: hypothetical protein DME00_20790 [Candidatus Rokuibacteriota bacterium]|nr:MAG: hypothetical protein DME00_20790 [Candidatus Rokubacteria bacterium]
MNENAYRARAERGEIQIGTWVTMIRTPAVLTLLKAVGLDFARIDMEHSPFSIETVADMAALARAMDFPMVVRPSEGNREWITRLLDAGVWNLHVPQVDTPEQAAEVAACCRYAPLGERGMYGFGTTPGARRAPPAAGHGRAQERQGGGDADRQRGRCEADDQPRSHDHQLLLGRGGASGGLRLDRRGDSPGVAGALLSRSDP